MKKIILTILLILLVPCVCFSASQWDKTIPQATTLIQDYDVEIPENNEAVDRLLKNYRQGARLTYKNGSTLTVDSGEIVCSNSGGSIRKFRSNSSGTDVSFSDIDTGAEASDTTYYVYAVADTDIEGFTFLISANSASPAGATYYRRLGSFYNDASSNISRIDNDVLLDIRNAESKSVNVTYQALTDGFVSMYAVVSAGTSSALSFYTDSSSPPTTRVQVLGGGNQTYDGAYFSSLYPVKKGDYYKATGSLYAITIFWIPFN